MTGSVIAALRAIAQGVRPDLDPGGLAPDAVLDDGGYDSLDHATILLEAQEKFGVTFPEDDLDGLLTFAGIAAFIEAHRA